MHYRRATADDFLAIAALDRGAWASNRFAEFIPDGEHVWRIWCEFALVFCAVDGDDNGDNAVVGAILAFPTATGAHCVHKVFVEDACRGQGVGSRLFEVLLAEIDTLGADAFLTVDPVNDAALALYTKWGFTEARLVKGFYRDYEDRYVLMRPAVASGS